MLYSTERLTVKSSLGKRLILMLSSCLVLMVLGQNSHSETRSSELLSTGETFWNGGQYDSARIFFERAVAMAKQENNLVTLTRSYAQTGIWYSAFSEFDLANRFLDSAISFAGRIDSLDEGIFFARKELGNLALKTGNTDRAREIHEKLAEDCLRLKPEADSLIGMAHDALAQTQANAGDLEDALEKALIARKHYQEWGNEESTALAYCENTLGIIYMYLSRFDEATASFESAIGRLEKNIGPDHPNVLQIRTNLGVLYGEMGLYWESYYMDEANLPYLDQLPPLPHLNGLLNLGSTLLVLEDYAEGLRYLELAEAFLDQHPDLKPSSLGYLLGQKSVALNELGQTEEANRLAEEAVAYESSLRGEDSPELIVDYVNLASLRAEAGHFEDALAFASKSLDISQKSRGEQSVRTAYAYSTLGDIYQKMGQPDSALWAYEEAAEIQLETGNVNSVIRQRIAQAEVLRDQEDSQQALAYLKKAWALSFPDLPFSYEGNDRVLAFWRQPHLVELLYEIGLNLEGAGAMTPEMGSDRTEGKFEHQYFLLAISAADSQQVYFKSPESRGNLLRRNRNMYESAIAYRVSFQEENGEEKRFDEEAWDLAERARAFRLREHLKNIEALNEALVPDSLLQQERYLRQRIAFLNASEDSTEESEEKFHLTKEYRELITRLENEYPTFHQLRFQRDLPDLEEVLDELSRWQAMISFYEGEESIYRFFLYDDELTLKIIPRDQQWENAFKIWSDFVSSPPPERVPDRVLAAGHDLYQQLISELPDKVEELHIIPDGNLGALSFESLLTTKPQDSEYKSWEYLGKDIVISYSPSAAIWLQDQEKETDYAEYIGLAPAFSGTVASASRRGLEPLTFNQQEVKETAELLKGRAFVENQATKDALLNTEEYSVVHFATHAIADESSMDATLYLSSDSIGDDGVLRMKELYGMQVESPLVVLSACQTAKGPVYEGEGVLSLARAFRFAGAKRVLASMWASDDEASYQLMAHFFMNLRKGRNTGEALYLSREEWLEDSPSFLNHPYYWSNFVLIGNPDGILLEVNRGLPWWEIFLGSMGLLFVFMWWWSRSGPKRPEQQEASSTTSGPRSE